MINAERQVQFLMYAQHAEAGNWNKIQTKFWSSKFDMKNVVFTFIGKEGRYRPREMDTVKGSGGGANKHIWERRLH